MGETLCGWRLVRAVAVESGCLLLMLLCRLLSLWVGWLWLSGVLFGSRLLWAVPLALVQGALLSPMHLGRMAYYAGQSFGLGWRRWPQAVSWRFGLWWRRGAAFLLCVTPMALLWGLGDVLSQRGEGYPILWLILGAVAGVLGMLVFFLWQCRYAPAPLLVLRKYPGGAALQLAARSMRGRVGTYVNFCGRWALPLLSCVLLVPAIWVIPRFHAARCAVLTACLQKMVPLKNGHS